MMGLAHKRLMTKRVTSTRIIMALALSLSVSACQSMRMPKLDLIKSPEFSEDAANIATDFPKTDEAPLEPTDIRSDTQWDKDARELQALRATAIPVELKPGPSKAEADAEFEALKAKAQAYKKDDPAGGPVQGFPDYEPSR